MSEDNHKDQSAVPVDGSAAVPGKKRTPEAQRALAEAAERRAAQTARPGGQPKEVLGPKGPDPVRYGDWENKGITSDF